MVRETMPGSFEDAMEWAEKQEDPTDRRVSTINVAQKWQRADAEAVDAWMAGADVSDEMRQEILEGPKPAGRRRARGGPKHMRRRPGDAAETP
jgi:hypothetical protein